MTEVFTPETPVALGPQIRKYQSELVHAYQAKDRAAVVANLNKYHALKELVSNWRHTADGMFDTAHLGFSDTEWMTGIERITKVDPDKPRGRKAAVKIDPADCV